MKKFGIEISAGQAVSAIDDFNFTAPVMSKAQAPIRRRGKAGQKGDNDDK